ncbi:MAG: FtsX-like permease family protein [Burkholderiaceae bacterium]|nr:FtsX-like permease family protein [Burkholderiaceae bacterium]
MPANSIFPRRPWSTRVAISLAFLREPRRWITAAIAVAAGTAGMILAEGFIEQIFRDFREDIVRSHYGHVQVVPAADARSAAGPGGVVTLPDVRKRVAAALDAFPGAVIAGRIGFAGLASNGERSVSFIGEGVEPDSERTLSRAVVIGQGRDLGANDAREVIVGEGLARSLAVGVGQKLTLLTNTPGGGVNAVEAEVVGLFYTATKAYDDRALRLPLRTAQRLVRVEGVSQIIAVLERTADSGRARQSVAKALAGSDVQVREWSDLADFYNKTVELFTRQLNVVRAIILAIVLLSISNSIARNVFERTREIGTMMALGATRASVARRFVGEAFGIGVVGAVLGIVAGGALAALVSAIGIDMPPPPGTARGFETGILFSAGSAANAAGLALAAALVASALPAWRAARLAIVDALRAER